MKQKSYLRNKSYSAWEREREGCRCLTDSATSRRILSGTKASIGGRTKLMLICSWPLSLLRGPCLSGYRAPFTPRENWDGLSISSNPCNSHLICITTARDFLRKRSFFSASNGEGRDFMQFAYNIKLKNLWNISRNSGWVFRPTRFAS